MKTRPESHETTKGDQRGDMDQHNAKVSSGPEGYQLARSTSPVFKLTSSMHRTRAEEHWILILCPFKFVGSLDRGNERLFGSLWGGGGDGRGETTHCKRTIAAQ